MIDYEINDIPSASFKNHPSATGELRDKVELRLNEEIIDGNYAIVKDKPRITSALAAIEKGNGQVRLIHDLSRPTGYAVNDYAEKDPCFMQSVNDAVNCVQPNYYMSKIDLAWAYRSVSIKTCQQILTGLEWTFADGNTAYLQDKKLPFGARKSPAIFNRLTQAVQRMMKRRGFENIVVYLDDFFITEPTFEACMASMNTLITLLRQLGFRINWQKVVDPCQELVFLGIYINTHENWLALDPVKKDKLVDNLQKSATQKRLSKTQLQTLAGRLSWAATVHPWGRTRLNTIFQLIRELNKSNHKVIKTAALADDLNWWTTCLLQDTNRRQIWDRRPTIQMATDSSNVGGGAFCTDTGAWLYINWLLDSQRLANEHINIKELAIIAYTVCTWAPMYPGFHFNVFSDNTFSVIAVNKGAARSVIAKQLLNEIATAALTYDIRVTASYIPGHCNDFADSISRFHSTGQIKRFNSLLLQYGYNFTPCTYWSPCHMSELSAMFLSPRSGEPP